MMATTLLGLTSTYKCLHNFKYFISSPQMFMKKMTIINFKKPMVFFILFERPMSSFFTLLQTIIIFFI